MLLTILFITFYIKLKISRIIADIINVSALRAGITYTSDLMVDSSFLILPKTAEMTDDLIKALSQWGFDNVISEGSISLGGDIGVSKGIDEVEDEQQKEKIGVE